MKEKWLIDFDKKTTEFAEAFADKIINFSDDYNIEHYYTAEEVIKKLKKYLTKKYEVEL